MSHGGVGALDDIGAGVVIVFVVVENAEVAVVDGVVVIAMASVAIPPILVIMENMAVCMVSSVVARLDTVVVDVVVVSTTGIGVVVTPGPGNKIVSGNKIPGVVIGEVFSSSVEVSGGVSDVDVVRVVLGVSIVVVVVEDRRLGPGIITFSVVAAPST